MFTSERQQLVQDAKVFVKNIPVSVSVKELHDHFTKVSPKLFVHVNTDEKGKRLNFGFVHYMSSQDAQAAIDQLSDSELKGQKLQLSRWMVKETRQIVQNETRRNLYIRNLPLQKKKVIETSLKNLLSPYGEIESMLVKKAPKLNTYYALVSFKEPQAAQNALNELTENSATLPGTMEPIAVSWYQRKNERKVSLSQQLNAISFKNLKAGITELTIRDTFGVFGKINNVILSLNDYLDQRKDIQKGYIVFEDDLAAGKAFEESLKDSKIKCLFEDEPIWELTSFKMNSQQRKNKNSSKCKTQKTNNFAPNPECYLPWSAPPQYMGGAYPSFYLTYFPMYYYPPPIAPGFLPMYPNNMMMMPPEAIMDPNEMFYLSNNLSPCLECEFEEYTQSNSSTTASINTIEQELKQSSIDNSPSIVDNENNEEPITPEGHVSTEESDCVEPAKEEEKEPSGENFNSKLVESKKESKTERKIICKSKRKYANLNIQKKQGSISSE